MNILIHYYRLGHYIGGAEVIALNQCAEFVNQGHNITILTADVGQRSKIFNEFIAVHPFVKLIELPLQVPIKTGDAWTDIDIESYLFGKYAAEFEIKSGVYINYANGDIEKSPLFGQLCYVLTVKK